MRSLADLKKHCEDKATALQRAFLVLIWNAEKTGKRLDAMERTIKRLEKKFSPRQPAKPKPKLRPDGTPKEYKQIGNASDGSKLFDWV